MSQDSLRRVAASSNRRWGRISTMGSGTQSTTTSNVGVRGVGGGGCGCGCKLRLQRRVGTRVVTSMSWPATSFEFGSRLGYSRTEIWGFGTQNDSFDHLTQLDRHQTGTFQGRVEGRGRPLHPPFNLTVNAPLRYRVYPSFRALSVPPQSVTTASVRLASMNSLPYPPSLFRTKGCRVPSKKQENHPVILYPYLTVTNPKVVF
eukprot:753396-Hanusia_phi.AAC.4